MEKRVRSMRVMLTTSLMTVAFPATVFAQDGTDPATQQSADEALPGEIVVTAQRRATSLQNTAAAVTAMSGEGLAEKGLTSVEALGVALPGVQISQYQGESSIFVRGIGTPIIVGGSESSTATYVDGVYIARPAAVGASFFDLASVQVLRGPQGTLYGRNATGGSVLLTTRAPTPDFGGEARLTVGNYGQFRMFGAVEGPIAGDTVLGRLAVQADRRRGYTSVTRPDGSIDRVENDKDVTLRAYLRFLPDDNLTIDLIGDYYQADDAANVFQYAGRGYADLLPQPSDYYTSFFPIILPWVSQTSTGRQSPALSRNQFGDLPYFNKPRIWGLTGKATYEFGEHSLQSITAYRATKSQFLTDIDMTDAFTSSLLRGEDHWQFSQDLQINSPSGRRFEWILGASYLREKNRIRNEFDGPFFPLVFQGLSAQLPFLGIPATGYDPDCCDLYLNGTTDTKAVAAYIDTRFRLLDRLTLAAGVRYSHETRGGTQQFGIFGSPVPDPVLAALGFYNAGPLDRAGFGSWTPKFAIEYRPSDSLFLYGSAGKGFKAGGFNTGSPENNPYRPEQIWSYEIGAKADLFDRRLQLALSAFKYDYSDLQVQDSVGQATIIRNAGSANIRGLEFEATARISRAFQVDMSVAYLDARFGDFSLVEPNRPVIYNPFTPTVGPVAADLMVQGSRVVGYDPVFGLVPVGAPPGFQPGTPFIQSYQARVSLKGNRLPRAPEWKLNVGAQYRADIGSGGSLTLRADYAWQDRIFFTAYNLPTVSQKSFGILSGRLTFTSSDDRWQLAGFINNAANTKALTNAVITGQVYGGIVIGNLLPPRTYGLEASIRF